MNEPQLLLQARAALEQAVQFSFDCQRPDGHWVAEVSADVTFTSEYVMFKYAIGLDLKSDGDALRRWLLHDQMEDGSWTLGPELAGNVSTTTEAYLALKILGMPPNDPAMLRARDFMIKNGGVAKVRFFTRFFLATFGLFPWESIPQLPAELILLPPSSPLNIYTLSSWARSTLIPILIVHHHKPIYALPNGLSSNNDFLDELWVDASNKNVPFAPPLPELISDREWIQFGFTAIDRIISQLGGLRNTPLRSLSRKRCVTWLLEHQEEAGEWAGFFPPMHGSIWALLLEGFSLEDKVIRLGLEGMERLASEDERGKRIAATVSPVWDTALMAGALCDAGLPDDPRVQQAADWVMRKQIYGPQGDWRVYSSNQVSGGWSFEYENTFYPDVDDTAVVILTLVKRDIEFVSSQNIADAVQWILGMQNHNGGWGAFDTNNESLWLHKIPFSDMDSLCDPASADITGRILECFGFLLTAKTARLDEALESKVVEASWRGVSFLIKEQEASGAWWGRWGSNYIYGTSNVLRGLAHFTWGNPEVNATVSRALKWFESIQNPDGGWGETLNSYISPELAGQGRSTGAQTAWALEAILPYRPVSSQAIQSGIEWLVKFQTVKSEHGSSWSTDIYTGTGFPKVLYLGYPFYHHAFPIKALAQYIRAKAREGEDLRPITLPSAVLENLRRPDVLMMVSGSRGDVQPFLHIASILQSSYSCRVRIASHLTHREVIEKHGFEFFEIAGSPEIFASTFTDKPNLLTAFMRGNFGHIVTTFKVMLADCLRSTIHNKPLSLSKFESTRPFLADVVTSHLPVLAHIHAAEMLQIPLVMVSTQPDIPTRDFPHPLLMTQVKSWSPSWWNYMTYFLLELCNWIAFGPFLEDHRRRFYNMNSRPLGWYIDFYNKSRAPHVGLWSPQVVPRRTEWSDALTVGGYAFSAHDHKYTPPQDLEDFLATEHPIIAVSFGSMHVSDPERVLSMISQALVNVGAKAVVTRFWTKGNLNAQDGEQMYFVDDIPHDWLLQHVQGFVHHGGAGHTATGLRAGVPALILPFCLDQNFWAARAHSLGTGPPPVPFKDLTVPVLTNALGDMLSGKYQNRGAEMASKISLDNNGAQVAAELIALQLKSAKTTVGCCLIPGLKSQWRHVKSRLSLSGVAAASLVSQGLLTWSDFEYLPAHAWADPTVRTTKQVSLFMLIMSWVAIFFQYAHNLMPGSARVGKNMSTNPVHEARVKRSFHDLNFVRGQQPSTISGGELDKQLERNWETLVAKELHQSFVTSL